MSETWNPRYLAYCRAHGEPDPEKMLERDGERWPGGVMTGFLIWTPERWAEWRVETQTFTPILTDEHHAAFDAWLALRTGGVTS